jgi:mono/diheme cytochrome c family protein
VARLAAAAACSALVGAGGVVSAAGGDPSAASAPTSAPASGAGAGSLYDRYCLACHGATGDGKGPAAPWLSPKPRDFGKALYRFRSTPSGKPPTDADLAAAIRDGLLGTSMPGFAGVFTDAQIAELVEVVKSFAPRRFDKPAAPVPVPVPVVPDDLDTPKRRARGEALFTSVGCVACHGPGLAGDGPAAEALRDEAGSPAPPRDLVKSGPKRPGPARLFLSLATGLDGSGMPAFAGAVSDDDLWSLVAFVSEKSPARPARTNAGPMDPRARGALAPGLDIAAQGPPPEALPPAAASLSAAQCGRCHPRQLATWKQSLHAQTASPGTLGQFVGASASFVASCSRCHMPLAEQRPGAEGFGAALQAEGVNCASCHVRSWTRRGPPRAGSKLLGTPSYPLVEDAAYERSDFCLPCHQLRPDDLVAGRPLLDTYREWLEGPYMRRGIQCQHCHMPEREHTFRGAHDAETVRQGLDLAVTATRQGGAVVATVSLRNVGAGHFLPTTPTPAGTLEVTLVDGAGRPVAAAVRQRIGRHIVYQSGWKQLEDTRIPPGESLTLSPRFTGAGVGKATAVRVVLSWRPDDYYEGFYQRLLAGRLAPEAKRLIEAALARAQKSPFVVFERTVPL